MRLMVEFFWVSEDIIEPQILVDFEANKVVIPDLIIRHHKESHKYFGQPQVDFLIKARVESSHIYVVYVSIVFAPFEP